MMESPTRNAIMTAATATTDITSKIVAKDAAAGAFHLFLEKLHSGEIKSLQVTTVDDQANKVSETSPLLLDEGGVIRHTTGGVILKEGGDLDSMDDQIGMTLWFSGMNLPKTAAVEFLYS